MSYIHITITTPTHDYNVLLVLLTAGCMGDTLFHIRIRCTGSGTGGTDLRPTNHHYGAPLVLMVIVLHPILCNDSSSPLVLMVHILHFSR